MEKHPLAKKAIAEGIMRGLESMEQVGKNDWRMWESKLKILGVSPVDKKDVTSGGGSITVIEKLYPPSVDSN